jgi:hypothetical protein
MAAVQPDLYAVSPNRSNVLAKETFHLRVIYGSSAVSSAEGWGGIGVADTAAGKMTITLPRTYAKLVGFRWGWAKCAAGAVYFPVILTDSVATADSNGKGYVIVETRTEAGTATDPANGDELLLEFDVSNDVVNTARQTITVT